jgi:hypothetical protein
MTDTTRVEAEIEDKAREVQKGTTRSKALAATIWGGLLSAAVTAVMVTSSTAGNEIHVLWDHLWCDMSALEGELLCPAITPRWAIKNIIEVFLDQWWRAITAGTVTGPIIGAIVYRTKSKEKEIKT